MYVIVVIDIKLINQKNLKDGLKHLLIRKIINAIVIVNVGYIQECYVEVSSLKIIYKH